MKKLIIFDLDGTLLNTIDDLAASTNHALASCGYPQHDVEAYPNFVGNGINKLLERALPLASRSDEEVMRLRAHFQPYYDAHNAVFTRPYEGIEALLATLQSRGVMLAVASNKYHSATVELIRHYFPTINFVAVLGQREGIPHKPHPIIVEEIIAVAGVASSDVLYVGDSDVDMQTALAAGVESVGVSWGFRSAECLKEAGANHIIEQASDLIMLVGE